MGVGLAGCRVVTGQDQKRAAYGVGCEGETCHLRMGAAEQLPVTAGELAEMKAVARFAALYGAGAELCSAGKVTGLLRVNLLKNQSGVGGDLDQRRHGLRASWRYNRTIEKLTVGMSLRNSHAAACVIMSAWSSCRPFGNVVICSMNGSVQAAFRSTYQSPACHSGAAANMRAVLPPSGLISITP